MENTTPTVAETLVGKLADAGVKNIYAITGDSLNSVTNAICNDGRIKFVHMRHEESAAFAADAEAQLTGKLACCAGSSGPGHIHLINGLYDAQRANAPVLAIASTCASAMFGTGYFQETNPTLLFSNCSVYNETACNAAQAAYMMQCAMQEAVSKGGVAVFGLPADVCDEKIVESAGAQQVLTTERTPLPSQPEINESAAILNGAKKIVVFAGSGAKNAVGLIKELASRLNAPLVTTFKSQLELTGDNPNYVGHLGYLGMWSAIDATAAADAILIIGANFPFPGFFPATAKIIQVDVRPERIGRKANVSLGVRADAAEYITALLPHLKQNSDDSFLKKALSDYQEIKTKMQEPVKNMGTVENIRPEYFFSLLDEMADDDAIFTVDTGMNCLWASHYLTPAKKRVMIGSFTHGSMANAMPQSIGCSMASGGRQVIALCGDGGFAMLLGELLTIAQYQLPIKIFVADNRALAYVKWEMELAGIKPNETNLTNPDFGELARSAGIQGETVKDPADLRDAMKRWLSAKGPALLSVMTETDAASFTFSEKLIAGAKPENPASNFMAPGA